MRTNCLKWCLVNKESGEFLRFLGLGFTQDTYHMSKAWLLGSRKNARLVKQVNGLHGYKVERLLLTFAHPSWK